MSTPVDAAQVRELIAKARVEAQENRTRFILDGRNSESGQAPLLNRLADALESALGAVERVSAVIDAPYPAASAAHNDALVRFRAEVRRAIGDACQGS